MTSRTLVGAQKLATQAKLKPHGKASGPRLANRHRIAPCKSLNADINTQKTNSACDLGQKLLIHTDIRASPSASSNSGLFSSPTTYLVLTLLTTGFLATVADTAAAAEGANSVTSVTSATSVGSPMYTLAENEDFWANVLRYVSYFFSVLLGTAYVAFKPIIALLKRPTTAILVIAAFAGLYYFVSTTVKAMIGVDEFAYEPSSIVTPYLQ